MNQRLGFTTGAAALGFATLLACGAVVGCGGGNKAVSSGSSSGSGSGAMSGTAVGSGSVSGMSGTVAMTGMSGMGMSGATTLPACPTPTFTPAAGAIMSGTNVSISAGGTPILFTTDGTMPTRNSPVYNAGTVGIQVTMAETFNAISSTMGATCTDSQVATAAYTIAAAVVPDSGVTAPPTPTFTPGGTMTTQSNDFTVSLASMGASNICYTLGATAPTCGAAGACGAGSMTFATATPIAISATNVAAGQVEIQAIACAADGTPSTVAMQQYTLQAATPTMTPAPGAQTYSATLMGAFASATMGATIDYTTSGTAPSCATPVAGQMTYAAPFALQSGTYNAIACKMGYLASAPLGPLTFTVSLTPPTVTPAAGALSAGATLTVSNAANPAASWVCYSTSATVPACGAAGVCTAGTLLTTNNMITGLTNGASVQVIACAPAGLSTSTVATQGPYTLQLAPPLILPDALTAPVASYTLTTPDGAEINHLNIVQASVGTATDQAGGYMCWLKDPGIGIAPACGANGTCLNGGTAVTGNGPTDIEAAMFGAGDSVAVITCPGTTTATGLGFEGSAVSTTVFVGAGQAMPPTISATDNSATQPITDTADPWFSKVNVVLTNPNAASMTICYTTNGTAPVCTAGSMAAGCATVDGTSSQNLNFKITAGGVGYVNPPMVTLMGGGGTCTGAPTAALTTGAVSSITVTGCAGYATPPSVTLNTGANAAATGTASETLTFTVSNTGAGYTTAPTVSLTPADGVGSCMSITPTVVNEAVTAIAATGCTFDEDPTVSITGGGGAGAAATARVSQTVLLTVTAGGNYYTANPAVTLKPTTGTGGTCTAVASTINAAGVVTAVTATGCSGFTDVLMTGDITATFASQGPADGSPNAAAAIAVPGNSISVPAIEKNGTTLQTLACNAGSTASPIKPAPTYDTQLTNPTIVATDTLTGLKLPLPGAGNLTITAGDTLTISTTSNFTDTTLVYTTDGTIPTCAAGGTTKTFAGASTTIPVPAPSVGTLTVHVIACGANQLPADEQHETFDIAVAAPVITSAVGATALGSGTDSNVAATNITAENVVTATITSPTAGSYICYSTDGHTTPTCGPAGGQTCPGAPTLINAVTGAVPVNTSGIGIIAIACVNGTPSVSTGPVNYTLSVTPAAVIGQTAACPSAVTIGFDMTGPNTGTGGPTPNANICYSPLPIAAGTCGNAGGGFTMGGVSCFTPGTAAPTVAVNLNETGLYTVACKANFTSTSVNLSQQATVTPYAPPAITVDGTLNTTEWSAALGDQFATSTAALGGFTFGETTALGDTLFFSEGGFTVAANTSVILYVRDEATVATGTATSNARLHGGANLSFAAEYAIEIDASAACAGACAPITYHRAAGAWAALAVQPAVAAAVKAAGTLEASILIANLPGAEAAGDDFEVAGEVYTTAPTHTGLWSVGTAAPPAPPPGYASTMCYTPAKWASAN